MSDNKDFIVDDYDFIKPEFVTTKEECYRLISQAYDATQALEQYRIAENHIHILHDFLTQICLL